MSVLRDRSFAIMLAAIFAFLGIVAAAHAWTHTTNNVNHGVVDGYSYPWAFTFPSPAAQAYSSARHYFDDGSFSIQCEDVTWGNSDCTGTSWGSAPCQKRSVNGVNYVMSRHWVRKSGCPGSLHA
jgi:hypothetical protein